MSRRKVKHRRKENNVASEPTPINAEQAALQRDSFLLPQAYVNGLMQPALEPLERRMMKELARQDMWITSLQAKVEALSTELERVQAENEGLKAELRS